MVSLISYPSNLFRAREPLRRVSKTRHRSCTQDPFPRWDSNPSLLRNLDTSAPKQQLKRVRTSSSSRTSSWLRRVDTRSNLSWQNLAGVVCRGPELNLIQTTIRYSYRWTTYVMFPRLSARRCAGHILIKPQRYWDVVGWAHTLSTKGLHIRGHRYCTAPYDCRTLLTKAYPLRYWLPAFTLHVR